MRRLGYQFQFAELAQQINDRMPAYVADRAARLLHRYGRCVNGAGIALLGVTYKPDIADDRESPAAPLARRLREAGAKLSYVDPLVAGWSPNGVDVPAVQDLDEALAVADLAILLQPHRSFDLDLITARARLLLDTRGVLPVSDNVERL